MVTHTYIHTHTHTHTYTHDNYSNPRCAHAHRGLMNNTHNQITALQDGCVHIFIPNTRSTCMDEWEGISEMDKRTNRDKYIDTENIGREKRKVEIWNKAVLF